MPGQGRYWQGDRPEIVGFCRYLGVIAPLNSIDLEYKLMTDTSVALLVDGDNISSDLAGKILRRTSSLGTLRVKRVYCRAGGLTNWASAPSFRRIFAGDMQNGADMLLSIDAMELALRDRYRTFAIASSDRDFSHIAHTLQEIGCSVIGLGEEKTPREFRKACVDFIELSPRQTNLATAAE